MEIVSSGFDGSLSRAWRRRTYQRFGSASKKNVKIITLRGGKSRFWKIKAIPQLRLKKASPIRLWIKLKNVYIKTMLRLCGSEDVFGSKRVSGCYSREEFRSRLIYEISKNLSASRELAG